jgi:hypothetical protein
MYGGFDVYKTYLAIKLHFTSEKYDYFKYDGKVNAKLDTFTKRNDRYFFHKLSKKYNQNDIVDFFVANFLHNKKKWVGNLLRNDGDETYMAYRKVKESLSYSFRNDCNVIYNDLNAKRFSFDDGFNVFGGQHPRVLQLLIQKKISYQTAVILDYFLTFSKAWDMEIKEKVVWKDISNRLKKFRSFVKFNPTECKMILRDVFV